MRISAVLFCFRMVVEWELEPTVQTHRTAQSYLIFSSRDNIETAVVLREVMSWIAETLRTSYEMRGKNVGLRF
jgi:hypothetical protein